MSKGKLLDMWLFVVGSAVQTNESVAKKPAASPRNLPRPLQSLSRIVPKPPVPADQKAHVVSAANKVEEKLQVEAGPNDVSQGLPTASSNCKTETGKKPPVPARSTPPAKPRPTTALKAAPEHPAPSARKEPEQKPGEFLCCNISSSRGFVRYLSWYARARLERVARRFKLR